MKNLKMKLVTFVSLFVVAFAVNAASFTNVYVFGDSLSDNGNLEAILGAPTPTRFTNGPVAVEIVGGALGHAVLPSFHLSGHTGGTNYAIAGAKVVDDDGNEATPDINLPTQVNAFLAIHGGVADPGALYIVMIGGNDIRAARDIRAGGIFASSPSERQSFRQAANDSLDAAAASEKAQILKLIAAGATNIMVVNAGDIGAIPETDLVAAGLLAGATSNYQENRANRFTLVTAQLSARFNRELARELANAENETGISFIEYDLDGFLDDRVQNAEDYGLTNTDDACIYIFSQGGAINPECSDFPTASGFLFWDEIHPTTQNHQAAGAEMAGILLGL